MKYILSIQKAILPLCTFYFSVFTFELYAQPGAFDSSFGNNGQVLLKAESVQGSSKQIDIAMLRAGIYFIELLNDTGERFQLKLVKEQSL